MCDDVNFWQFLASLGGILSLYRNELRLKSQESRTVLVQAALEDANLKISQLKNKEDVVATSENSRANTEELRI